MQHRVVCCVYSDCPFDQFNVLDFISAINDSDARVVEMRFRPLNCQTNGPYVHSTIPIYFPLECFLGFKFTH